MATRDILISQLPSIYKLFRKTPNKVIINNGLCTFMLHITVYKEIGNVGKLLGVPTLRSPVSQGTLRFPNKLL